MHASTNDARLHPHNVEGDWGGPHSPNPPFVDGNKRTAFMAAKVFLARNGYHLTAPEDQATQTLMALAASDLDEAEFTAWLRANTESRP